ncbi:rhodanese-like domain-containing protein [Pedobacter miscanthi]|uniref:Rhodanese-like domain-containing protein n=1 Tax=Pedobacter miscanthi TaxID=2259170 RepID=A0A366LDG8_9SPHI|nr:rhodanese-like domain-containing protein [Pedobacter miscanthi]RBQ11533.1 rhodanese-like domain-containing protein [Pedobacter miscanthi]
MKYIVFSGIMATCIFFIFRIFATATDNHSMENLLSKKPVILDVRTPGEYSTGHIKGSINIPLTELENGTPLTLDHHRPILTCCSHGVRSVRAAKLLKARGYKNVEDGGAWTNLQMILDRIAPTPVSKFKR